MCRTPSIIASLLLLVLLTGFRAPAAAPEGAADAVPRTRLLSDSELLGLCTAPASDSGAVRVSFPRGSTRDSLDVLLAHLEHRSAPVYFFDPRTVERRVRTLDSLYPDQSAFIRRSAESFMETYGADVDWRMPGHDVKGRPHTPNTVRLLARQWQAENIALSYYLGGRESRYYTFFREHLSDFVRDFEGGRVETGGNDIFERFYAGHRVRNWLFTHELLLGTPAYTRADRLLMLKLFLLHGAKLSDGCRKFNWGNHQLVGLTALFELSLMHPEFPVMREWNTRARALILEHLEKEIAPDGFQFERASHYFKLDIVNYFRVIRLAELNGTPFPSLVADRFHAMFDAIVALARPDRRLPVLQDAQDTYRSPLTDAESRAGLGTTLAANAAELAEPTEEAFMSLAALLYGNPAYRYFGAEKFPAAFFWLMDESAPERYSLLTSRMPELGSTSLPQTGYYVMRSGWSPDALYMVIDGGLARYKPDHTHGGVLGLAAYGFGQELLPTYRVRYSDPAYKTMKNSLVKNVALADLMVQGREWKDNNARTGFGIWQKLPQPTVRTWWTGESFDLFEGSHDGFADAGVRYARGVLFLKNQGWIVVDAFRSQGEHSYQQIWQGDYTVDSAGTGATAAGPGARFTVCQAGEGPFRTDTVQLYHTRSVRFEHQGSGPHMFVTLLLPEPAGGRGTQVASSLVRGQEGRAYRKITLRTGDTASVLYGTVDAAGDAGVPEELSSDARLVAVRSMKGTPFSALLVEGTRMRVEGIQVAADRPCTLELVRDARGLLQPGVLAGQPTKITIIDPDGRRREISPAPRVVQH